MEAESNCVFPFLDIKLLNRALQIETKVNIKPTNTGHVDLMYYKRELF